LTNKQIADQLFISERTVETHRKNIFRKTNIHSAVGLVEFARKRKLI
jgi:DNA-binding NarL/FixJ family response regulator